MQKIITFLLLCQIAAAEKHFVEFQLFLYFELPDDPQYVVSEIVDGFVVFHYDNNIETTSMKVTHDWMGKLIEENEEHWVSTFLYCLNYKRFFKNQTDSFNEPSRQTADIPIIQLIIGCELDDETNKVDGYVKFGNNGEDFIAIDINTRTWIASDSKAELVKKEWDENEYLIRGYNDFISSFCLKWLNLALSYGKSYLTRKDLPSVSLLQRSPSSPVSCHATGFYPIKALIYWMKDGEEIHEGVEHGDILPNHDGSFQMNVVLDVSSIVPEEWGRYECMFQLSGVQNFIITKLSKDAIRTNSDTTDGQKNTHNLSVVSIATIATVAVVIVIILAVLGLTAIKRRNVRSSLDRSSTPSSDTISL